MAKMYNGKKVFDRESFSYELAKIGDYVTEEVVDDAINCLPPASMTTRCSQMGEPISDRFDPDNHCWRSTYETFTKVAEDIWMYCGDCFRGEIAQRGRPLVYVGKGQS